MVGLRLILTRFMPIFCSLCSWNTFINGIPLKQTRNTATRTEDATFWRRQGQHVLEKTLNLKQNLNIAKNVVVFLGDGMGVSTVTAARILKGQLKNQPGEEMEMEFEKFDYSAMIKPYNTDQQTPDSAGTATAILCGVKTNDGVVGVDYYVSRFDCESQKGHEIDSILDWSLDVGKSVGVVTNTRITAATPASAYAHTANRYWESDRDMIGVTGGCKDTAYQLVRQNPNIQVIMGGGADKFYPQNFSRPGMEEPAVIGRLDGLNLVEEWKTDKSNRNVQHEFVYNKGQFDSVDPMKTDYLLGLFADDHMSYEIDRNLSPEGQPSLSEMVVKAIRILQRSEKGFVLFVEGGRIDHAHHINTAALALYETIELDNAIRAAVQLVSSEDTLVVVTADHSHVFTIGGYPVRGNPILGISQFKNPNLDNKPRTTLMYANGPSYNISDPRPNVTDVDTFDVNYRQQTAVPIDWETHGGEDVVVYARGPMAHLFHGVQEQSYIAHALAYASCVGENKNHCLLSLNSSAMPSNGGMWLMLTVLYIMQIWLMTGSISSYATHISN